MKLGRLVPAQYFPIQVPIWRDKDGNRAVGLAEYKLSTHNEVEIMLKNKDGMRLYPNKFYISGEKARTYSKTAVKGHPDIKLHVVPIKDLELLERE